MRKGTEMLLRKWDGNDNPGEAFGLLKDIPMVHRASFAILFCLLMSYGCTSRSQPVQLQHRAEGKSPEILAVYEAWFGEPNHVASGYSSHDPDRVRKQIDQAKGMGISAFVVDWYGDRDQTIDQNYAMVQKLAAKAKFHVAMMYDETNDDEGATDEAIADFTMFDETYLSSSSAGREAYVTYEGRPVIFVFPKSGHTDWDKVRAVVNRWNPAPLLIDENIPGQYAGDFDGFYPWINPGPQGWSGDGNQWGEQYLNNFYQTMSTKYPDKIVVGGAWAKFDDSKASWGLNRHISARCGQTLEDTMNYWKRIYPAGQAIPFVLIETWNDFDEGSGIETGISNCGNQAQQQNLQSMLQVPPPGGRQ